MYDLWQDVLVEYELPVDYTLPCDDISIYSFERNCRMEYRMSDYYNFVNIIASDMDCVWMNTDYLFEPVCVEMELPYFDHTVERDIHYHLILIQRAMC